MDARNNEIFKVQIYLLKKKPNVTFTILRIQTKPNY